MLDVLPFLVPPSSWCLRVITALYFQDDDDEGEGEDGENEDIYSSIISQWSNLINKE